MGRNTLDANGLTITAGNSTIRGLVINRFTGASGSARNAIALSGGGGNVIEGNFLGTDAPGRTGPSFADNAVSIESGSDNNLIGGTAPSARNVISGNGNVALFVATSGNIIQGNFIGTQRDGRNPLGNHQGIGFVGVGNANNNLVGGTVPGAGNIIAFNDMQGVLGEAAAGTGNAILGNSIFGNGALGIDWFPEGPTLNDIGDSDDGFNKLQNFPVISTVQGSFPSVTLTGSLNSTPNTVFRLEFFGNAGANSSGFGEGGFFLGSTDVTTDANGDASYNVTLDVPGTPASIAFTATATDPAGNTSEFSAAFRTKLLNISTRMQVLTGDSVPIGGFIVTGLSPKKVIVRGIGPSLGRFWSGRRPRRSHSGTARARRLRDHATTTGKTRNRRRSKRQGLCQQTTSNPPSWSRWIPAPTPRFCRERTALLALVWWKPTTWISRLIRNWPISAPAVLSTLVIT